MLPLLLVTLALLRPVDHDESQYVAAAVLTAHGLLPYRDFAYLQTPLQPFAFAPIAWAAGVWTWPALRIANTLLGAISVLAVGRAARGGGATPRAAMTAALLFAGCDVLLFSVGTARNDALPVALFALALPLIVRPTPGTWRAVGTGLLLAGAAAAKISYAIPAVAYGAFALFHPARRPLAVLAGALPVLAFVAWSWSVAPDAFVFDVVTFPARAPGEYYAGDAWKSSLAAKAIDTIKFLALGAALPVLVVAARDAWRRRRAGVLDLLVLAGLVAALLPSPTWRQYLLPVLPPLFVRFALLIDETPPGRTRYVAVALFAVAGLMPSIAALAVHDRLSLGEAIRQGRAAARAMDAWGIAGPVATLSPELLPATRRLPAALFATGPFYFRSTHLLGRADEVRFHLVSHARPSLAGVQALLTGGERAATGGDAALDRALATVAKGWCARRVPGTDLTLYFAPGQAACTRRLASSAS